MRIGFNGRLQDSPEIRAGFIGCGSHAFRNIYPALQFAPVRLVACCDLDAPRAQAYAAEFGAERWYTDHRQMLEREDLDAVFVVTGYGPGGRPQYPSLAIDCMEAGCHVWTEKPPAATTAEIEEMMAVSARTGRNVLVGMKKMFFPANGMAHELMSLPDFGRTSLVSLQYPQSIPGPEEIRRYLQDREHIGSVVGFLDHLCHPASLLVMLAGMPQTVFIERAFTGAGFAVFTFDSGVVASLTLSSGQSLNGGIERTMIVSDRGRHIIVDNNHRVSYHRIGPVGYGDTPNFYVGNPEEATAVWEPEFSLGQLYNKGLFLLGYYGEVNEFALSILENRPPSKGTLEQAWQVTRIFEAFAEGPGHQISLSDDSFSSSPSTCACATDDSD